MIQTFCRGLTPQILPPERNCNTSWEWVSDDIWILIWTCGDHRLCSCRYSFIVMGYQDLAELSWWEELGPCAKCCNRVTSGVTGVVRNKLQFSQRGELSLDPLVTRTVGLYVRALAYAGLPAALVLGETSWLLHHCVQPGCSIPCPVLLMSRTSASYWEGLGLQASYQQYRQLHCCSDSERDLMLPGVIHVSCSLILLFDFLCSLYRAPYSLLLFVFVSLLAVPS